MSRIPGLSQRYYGDRRQCGHWTGCGCHSGAECCLDCPLAECVFVTGLHPTSARVVERRQLARTLKAEGLTATSVAVRLGISKRSVFRFTHQT